MTILLSHISALEYWLSPQDDRPAATRASESFQLPTTAVSVRRLRRCACEGTFASLRLGSPLHVLVGKPVHGSSKLVVHHTCSASLRSHPFFRVSDDLFVCSIELAFMQVAARMDLTDLIRLGFELCGTYSLSQKAETGFFARKPLTTVRRLKTYAADSPRARGRKKALRAARYIQQGSASPAETRLAMSLLLPHHLGGFNLPRAALNKTVDLSPKERRLAQRRFLVCDMYWEEARLGIEYDSDSNHTGSMRIAADAQRRNALTAGGITVITITRAQYNNLGLFAETARSIAKMLGVYTRPRCADFEAKQERLRETLRRDPEWIARVAHMPLAKALETGTATKVSARDSMKALGKASARASAKVRTDSSASVPALVRTKVPAYASADIRATAPACASADAPANASADASTDVSAKPSAHVPTSALADSSANAPAGAPTDASADAPANVSVKASANSLMNAYKYPDEHKRTPRERFSGHPHEGPFA